ncbi:MAG: hypothetical protein ACQEXJ_19655 [Myxococcota bacterium]
MMDRGHESRVASRWRRWGAHLAIAAWLGLHVAVPASYYVGEDKEDERFAWRMFSAYRMKRCGVGVWERTAEGPDAPARSVEPYAEMQAGWVSGLRMARPDVVERFVTWRCDRAEVASVHLRWRCVTPQGERADPNPVDVECAGEAEGAS